MIYKKKRQVELPPTSSNLGWLMEEDELYKDSPLKGLLAQMARSSKGEKKVFMWFQKFGISPLLRMYACIYERLKLDYIPMRKSLS